MGKSRWILLLTVLVGAGILAILFKFSQKPHLYEEYLVTNVTALLLLPMLLIFIVFRHEPSNFGFALGDVKSGYRLAAILFIGVLLFLVPASRMHEFQHYYPLQKQAEANLAYFGYFELTYGLYLFCWEFFFRGFLLFGLSRYIGLWSVFVQAAAFGIMHYGKPAPEVAVSFAAGIILGILALRARSFVPGFVLHWASAITFDVLIILAKGSHIFMF
jgi:uncharacterized protein